MDVENRHPTRNLAPILKQIRNLQREDLQTIAEFIEREIENAKLMEEEPETEIEECRLILGVLSHSNDLSGPEAALLGSLLLHIQTNLEWFSARQLNNVLKSHDIIVANISATLNSLSENKFVRFQAEEGSQKLYRLANDGFLRAREILAIKM